MKNTILLVDDNAQNLHVMGNALKQKKHELIFAMNGEIALKTTAEKNIDLILLDISMPGMDGYDVCRNLKHDPKTKDIPVIFLTARSQTEDIIKGFEVGAVDYVTKPFQIHELMKRVNTHLKLREQQIIIENQNKELLQSKHSLSEQNKVLHKLNATKDRLFSIIAHDLRSPLGSVVSLLQLLLMDFNKFDDEKKEECLTEIFQSVTNTHKLLDNLLTWANSQLNNLKLCPEKLSLHEVISEAIAQLKVIAKNKEIELVNLQENNKYIFADKDTLLVILRNLISNAIKFTPRKGKIEIKSDDFFDRDNKYVQIQICDTGTGMPEDVLNNLFKIDKATSSPGTENEYGTGLGLILCKEFTEMNNGIISASSTEGKGSCFSVALPIAK